jgi:hypothetical protein
MKMVMILVFTDRFRPFSSLCATLGRPVVAEAPGRPPRDLGTGPLGRGSLAWTAGTAPIVVRHCPEPLPAGPVNLLD